MAFYLEIDEGVQGIQHYQRRCLASVNSCTVDMGVWMETSLYRRMCLPAEGRGRNSKEGGGSWKISIISVEVLVVVLTVFAMGGM